MANVKISDLTAYTDAASTDILPIVDIGNDVTKKITIGDVVKAVPLGTAALPGLAFDGDPNSGVYSPGADQVAISTGGTGRLFVDANGKIGFGAASTGATFRVIGTTGSSIIEANGVDSDGFADIEIKSTGTSGASRLYFSDTAAKSGLVRYLHSTDSLEFTTNGSVSPALVIDSSGRLLVGTSTDSGGALLQVNGDRVRIATAKTPASATATGTTGEVCWDANYVYVCVATNTWKRSAISTW
jgi:hypothetical protein